MNTISAQRQYSPTFKGNSNKINDPDNIRKLVNGTAIGAAAGASIGSIGTLIKRECNVSNLHCQFDAGVENLKLLKENQRIYDIPVGLKGFCKSLYNPDGIATTIKEKNKTIEYFENNAKGLKKSLSKLYRNFYNKKILIGSAIGLGVGAAVASTAMLLKIVNTPKQDNTEQS